MDFDQNIKPGTFRMYRENVAIQSLPKTTLPALEKPLVLISSVFPRLLKLHPEIKQVYYPCSGTDVSASDFFDDIIYTDIDGPTVNALRRAGLTAYQSNANQFNPERRIDLLILFNPHLNFNQTSDLVKKVSPGLVLTNNYHHTADYLMANNSLKLEEKIEKLYYLFAKK